MKARNPINKEWYYFFDKCMPFGSSISCAHFQSFSDAISHVMKVETGKENVNYLDDFLFIAFNQVICDQQVEVFLEICSKIKFPMAVEKTCWATNLITFLGMLLDKVNQIVAIPENKVDKALTQIQSVLSCRKHKVMVLEIQKLCGILNFLCQAIVLGRDVLESEQEPCTSASRGRPPQPLDEADKMGRNMVLQAERFKAVTEIPRGT